MAKILIIEDTKELRENIADALELEGFEIVQAEDGKKGVKLAFECQPDLILCDILMPGMDGYEVLQSLKQENGTAPFPFVFITALSERKNYRDGMDLGADDFLVKPFTLEELFNAVRTRLAKKNSFETIIRSKIEAIENELNQQILELKGQNENQKSVIDHLSTNHSSVVGELNEKQELLMHETIRSVEINLTLQNVTKQLESELNKSDLSKEQRKVLVELRNKLRKKSLLMDSWTIFQLKFNQTYPNFASQIVVQFPQLTQQDLIIVFATLINLNSNQIAGILNISPESVRKSKYRLKRKMGLGKENDFTKFVHEMNILQN